MSRPAKRSVPAATGTSPRIARPIDDLPEPDSPTRPSVCFAAIERLTRSTARTGGRRWPSR